MWRETPVVIHGTVSACVPVFQTPTIEHVAVVSSLGSGFDKTEDAFLIRYVPGWWAGLAPLSLARRVFRSAGLGNPPFLSRHRRALPHESHEACPRDNVRLARRNARLRLNGLVSDRRVPAHSSSNCDPDPVRTFASSPKTLTAFASPRVLYSGPRHSRSL
jgi:hypothetical protein